jgi:hypothetical protein
MSHHHLHLTRNLHEDAKYLRSWNANDEAPTRLENASWLGERHRQGRAAGAISQL